MQVVPEAGIDSKLKAILQTTERNLRGLQTAFAILVFAAGVSHPHTTHFFTSSSTYLFTGRG